MTTFIKMPDINRHVEDAVKSIVKDTLNQLRNKAIAELNQKFIEIGLRAEQVLKVEMMRKFNSPETDIVVSVAFLGIEE